jgi:CRP-like cAMP-binding protein
METGMILRNIAKLISLTAEEEAVFVSMLRYKKLKKRQYLLQAEEICRFEYFVVSGCLRSYYTDERGIEHAVQFAIEDWWIGDMRSFVTQTPAWLNIDALEDSEVLMLSRENIDQLYTRIPAFERYFRIRIQNAFIAEQQRIGAGLSQSAEQRYLAFIEKYPAMEQRIPQVHIAAYLGITPEFLSTIRRKIATRKQ